MIMDFYTYMTYGIPLVVTAYMIIRLWAKSVRPNSPPGPYGLPLIGNALQLASRPVHLALTDLAGQYGDVFAISAFGEKYVVVNSARVAREALITRKSFDNRPVLLYIASLLTGNGNDIAMADYTPSLVLKRKVVHSAVHTYGKNTRHLEAKICEEINFLFRAFEANAGKPFNAKKDISLAILNTIFAILFGCRYSADDPEFCKMLELTDFFNYMCAPDNILNVFPWLCIFPFSSLKKLREGIAFRDRIYKRRYMEHKESFDAHNIRDLTDALIKTFAEETRVAAEQQNKAPILSERDMLLIINDVFVAGFETQTTSLYWFLLYMITYLDIQTKCQEELDNVIGRDKLPGLSDREHLPYIQALVAEILRCSSVLPVGIPKKTMKDSTLDGYDIPKGTGLLINLWAIHHDEREWSEPNVFEPSRFLDSDGKFVGYANKSFLPFGAGRRICLGESLAKIQLFLVIARILHKFHLRPGSTQTSMETENFYSNSPKPYTLCAIPRS